MLGALPEAASGAYSMTPTGNGATITFIGGADPNGLVITRPENGGLMSHNRPVQEGYANANDFDSSGNVFQIPAAQSLQFQVNGSTEPLTWDDSSRTAGASYSIAAAQVASSSGPPFVVNRSMAGQTRLRSSAGPDVVTASGGASSVDLGAGNDQVNATGPCVNASTPFGLSITGGPDSDTVTHTADGGGQLTNTSYSVSGASCSAGFTMVGSSWNTVENLNLSLVSGGGATISTTTLRPVITSGSGNETFTMAAGSSLSGGSISAGGGTDVLNVSALSTGQTLVLGGTTAFGTLSGIEEVVGTAQDDDFTAGSSGSVLRGGWAPTRSRGAPATTASRAPPTTARTSSTATAAPTARSCRATPGRTSSR